MALAVLRGGQAASAESCTHPAKRDQRFPPPIAERQRLPNVRIYPLSTPSLSRSLPLLFIPFPLFLPFISLIPFNQYHLHTLSSFSPFAFSILPSTVSLPSQHLLLHRFAIISIHSLFSPYPPAVPVHISLCSLLPPTSTHPSCSHLPLFRIPHSFPSLRPPSSPFQLSLEHPLSPLTLPITQSSLHPIFDLHPSPVIYTPHPRSILPPCPLSPSTPLLSPSFSCLFGATEQMDWGSSSGNLLMAV